MTNYLIDIKDYKVKALIEFEYHWKKASKKRINTFSKNPKAIMGAFMVSVVLVNMILMIYYLNHTAFYKNMLELRYELEKIVTYYFRVDCKVFKVNDIVKVRIGECVSYNSLYFLFSLGLNLLQKILQALFAKYEFKRKHVIYHIFAAFFCLNAYFIIVQEKNFRIGFIVLTFIIMILGIIQHKNNFPSFKQPQFERIRKYLNR